MQLSVIISVLLPLLALFNTGDAITAWSVPVIATGTGAGALSFAESVATGTAGLATTVVATPGAGRAIVKYEIVTAVAPFSLEGITGELSLASALDFATTASYVIEIRAVDDTTPTPLSATATITITVVPPTFGASVYSECIADAAVSGTTLATILATEVGGTVTLTHSIASADASTSHFTVVPTGVITSNAVMDAATTPKYELILKADNGISTATAVINVEVGCSSATTVAIGITTLLVALVTALQ